MQIMHDKERELAQPRWRNCVKIHWHLADHVFTNFAEAVFPEDSLTEVLDAVAEDLRRDRRLFLSEQVVLNRPHMLFLDLDAVPAPREVAVAIARIVGQQCRPDVDASCIVAFNEATKGQQLRWPAITVSEGAHAAIRDLVVRQLCADAALKHNAEWEIVVHPISGTRMLRLIRCFTLNTSSVAEEPGRLVPLPDRRRDWLHGECIHVRFDDKNVFLPAAVFDRNGEPDRAALEALQGDPRVLLQRTIIWRGHDCEDGNPIFWIPPQHTAFFDRVPACDPLRDSHLWRNTKDEAVRSMMMQFSLVFTRDPFPEDILLSLDDKGQRHFRLLLPETAVCPHAGRVHRVNDKVSARLYLTHTRGSPYVFLRCGRPDVNAIGCTHFIPCRHFCAAFLVPGQTMLPRHAEAFKKLTTSAERERFMDYFVFA
jgi:hypothetical protein